MSLSVVLTPVVVLAPTFTRPHAPHAHPVAPSLHRLALGGVDAAALSALPATLRGRHTVALTAAERTTPFSMVGVTWDGKDGAANVDVQIRTRTNGAWSGWHDLEGADDASADANSRDAVSESVRAGTAPYWVGPSDGVQVRVDGAKAPHGMRVELVDPGTSAADGTAGTTAAPAASALADVAQPSIVTRAGWGADESLRDGNPDYTPPIKVAFVHHTDTQNSYTASQSASIVRSIYAYHTKGRGWSDIGYNFLIDKYGTIFEGRYGGVDKAVLGAHTGGFNSHSFAASLMGNFSSAQPSSKMLTSLEKLFAWKLSMGYLNPMGTATLVSSGGGTSRYSSGTSHTFNVISGHRDAGYTTCPGTYVYSKLGTIRSAVRSLMGPSFIAPSATPAVRGLLEPGGFTVSAGAVNPLTWTLTVTEATTGAVVRTLSGTASPTSGVTAAWDRLNDQNVLTPPGDYLLRLNATSSDGRTARPWSTKVTITSPVTLGAPAVGAWNDVVPVSGTAPAGSSVQLELRKLGTTDWLPGPLTTADAKGAYASSLLLDDDYDVRATAASYPSKVVRIRVAPLFSAPADLALGDTLALTGTARPGAAVTVDRKRPSTSTWSAAGTTTADDTGHWQISLPMTDDAAVRATATGVSTPVVTVWVRPTVTSTSPVVSTLGSPVQLTGTGAPAGVLSLQVQTLGATTWTTTGTAKADSTGAWTGSVPLTNNLIARAIAHGRPSLETRSARVRPTASAPAAAPWGSTVTLQGTAAPLAAVQVTRAVDGKSPTTTSTTASSAGRWSTTFSMTGVSTWHATSDGLDSSAGSTAVQPVITAPVTTVPVHAVALSGSARPASTVAITAAGPAGAALSLGSATADSSGHWALSASGFPKAGAWSLQATSSGVRSPKQPLTVLPVSLSAPAAGLLNKTVTVSGYARPASAVGVQIRRYGSTTWTSVARVSARASDGRWSATVPLPNDVAVRAFDSDGISPLRVVRIRPSYSSPASVAAGTIVHIRGTARPGVLVAVWIKQANETAAVKRRLVRASSTGYWMVTWKATRTFTGYAVVGSYWSSRGVTRVV